MSIEASHFPFFILGALVCKMRASILTDEIPVDLRIRRLYMKFLRQYLPYYRCFLLIVINMINLGHKWKGNGQWYPVPWQFWAIVDTLFQIFGHSSDIFIALLKLIPHIKVLDPSTLPVWRKAVTILPFLPSHPTMFSSIFAIATGHTQV